jgi:hypothetical protein
MQFYFSHFGFDDIPRCPSKSFHDLHMKSGSACIIFILAAVSCFVFAISIGIKYNSVRVFNKKVKYTGCMKFSYFEDSNAEYFKYNLDPLLFGVCHRVRNRLLNLLICI